MSAGDVVVKGWFGGTPAYRELKAPDIAYDAPYSEGGLNVVTKRLTRYLICPAKDAQTVLQQLASYNASLSISVATNSGGTATVSYGSGWNLRNVGQSTRAGGAFTELRVEYERKGVVSPFEFGLPANLTITEANGIATVQYKTTMLERWDSGKNTSNSSGISASFTLARQIYTRYSQYTVAITSRVWTLNLLVNGVVTESFNPDPGWASASPTYDGIDYQLPDARWAQWNETAQLIEWDTTQTNHIKLLYAKAVWRDWDITGL